MTIAFPFEHLPLPDGRVIAMKYIESIKFPDGEESVVDKLKNDCTMEVVMTSGVVYVVSMLELKKQQSYKDDSVIALREAVFSRWLHLDGSTTRYSVTGGKR